MLNKRYFARDENGNIKHKKPCQTPGCTYPNEHLCFYGKPDTLTGVIWRTLTEEMRGTKNGGRMSEHQKAAIAETKRRQHAEQRVRDLPRDLRIQEDRDKGYTVTALAKKWRLSPYKIRQALTNSRTECML